MLSVPEENAGQLMKCSFCSKYFSVPALPQAAVAAGSGTPSTVTSQAAPGSPRPAGSPSPPLEPDVFAVAPEPAAPQTATWHQDQGIGGIGVLSSPPSRQQPAEQVPPPPPPTGHEQMFTIWISPRVVRWFAPVALFLVLILLFFPWTGVYPGGYAVYTQNALQMIWGGYSVDPVGDKVIGLEKAITEAMRANWLMFFYLLLILAALVLAASPLVLTQVAYPLPQTLQPLWPWRTVLLLAATLVAFLILLAFLVNGSGFENAVITVAEKPEKAALATEKEPPNPIQEEIARGLRIGRLNLSRTFWLHCAVFSHCLALAGAGLELWLERRGARPLPRLEAHW